MSHFISVDTLADELDQGSQPVLLDLRYDPGKGSAPARFAEGHVPTARLVELESVFAGPVETEGGNAPLPQPEALETALRALGLANDTDIVVYDDTSGGPAARAWWVLTWAGANRVRVLDGGLRAWVASGRAVVTDNGDAPSAPGSFTVQSGQLASVGAADIEKLLADTRRSAAVVDTRGKTQFDGVAGDPRTGHIPGARNLPQQTRFTNPGGFLAERDIVLSAVDPGDTASVPILYCGAGISSAYAVLALKEYGVSAALYPGSFSEWVADPARPVEQA